MNNSVQQIPVGYKNTEIGFVPEEWVEKSFGDICTVNQGLQIPIEERKKTQVEGSKVYITIQYLNSLDLPEFISTYTPSVCCDESDILMTRTGNTGIVVHGVSGVFHNNFFKIRFDRKKINDLFLVYVLRSHRCQKTILEKAGTSTIPDLNHGDFYSIKLALPDYKEQTAIANALSDVDALIQELEKLVAKKQAIKTATMQQLLTGRTRLPQFAHHPDGRKKGYKPSELGEIPEDWEVLSLGTASSFSNGRAYALHEWETAGTPVIRLQNLTGRGEDYYYSNMQLPERQYCQEGDLLFMWSATFGPVIWKGPKAIYHYHIWKIICNSGFSQAFMLHLLDDMTEKLKSGSSSGGTMLHVTKHKMETTKAAFPVFQEQAAIGTLLDDMDEEIRALENRLNKTRQIKQGMMQELLTGQTRLGNV